MRVVTFSMFWSSLFLMGHAVEASYAPERSKTLCLQALYGESLERYKECYENTSDDLSRGTKEEDVKRKLERDYDVDIKAWKRDVYHLKGDIKQVARSVVAEEEPGDFKDKKPRDSREKKSSESKEPIDKES